MNYGVTIEDDDGDLDRIYSFVIQNVENCFLNVSLHPNEVQMHEVMSRLRV